MPRFRGLLAVAALSTILAAACTQKEDPKVAELQKQVEEMKQQLAANNASAKAATATAEAPAATPAPALQTAAPQPATAAPKPASRNAGADDSANAAKAAQQTADTAVAATERNARAIDENKKGVAENKAAVAKQGEAHAALKSDVESMKSREYTLPAGTVIAARTTAIIDTNTVKNGSIVDALLEKDLVIEGTTLARAGAHVTCIVVSSDQGGRIKGTANLQVAARSIAGERGNTITLRTEGYEVSAKSTKGRDAIRTGIATGAGAIIGVIAGGGKGAAIGAGAGAAAGVGTNAATRGSAAAIPAETLIEFTLAAPSTVVFRQ
jgi:hypothetical protein